MANPTIEERVERLEELVSRMIRDRNPWAEFAGVWKDDPTFDEFMKIIAEHRREIDAGPTPDGPAEGTAQ